MKKHSSRSDAILVAALTVFVFGLGAFLAAYGLVVAKKQGPVTCTQEARICPDGSAVARTGPLCEFASCPNGDLPNRPGITEEPFVVPSTPTKDSSPKKKEGATLCTLEIKTCPDGSFVTRTGSDCEFAPCPSDLELEVDR